MPSSRPKTTAPGVIDPMQAYTTAELRKRFGWGPRSLSMAKRDGLRVLRRGNTRVVRGSDFIEWLDSWEVDR